MKPGVIFVDFETGGLDTSLPVLEVGAVSAIAGPDFEVLETFELVFPFDNSLLWRMEPEAIEMHIQSGLLRECTGPIARTREETWDAFGNWITWQIRKYFDGLPMFGGSNCTFDRNVLKYHRPELHKLFTHRNIDASVLRSFYRAIEWHLNDDVFKPMAHRALADAKQSRDQVVWFAERQ